MANNRIEIWLKDWDNVYKRLPVNPETINIASPFDIKTVEIASLGERSLPGERGMKRISFTSFFPRDYNPSYCEYTGFDAPWAWVEQIEKWRDIRKNIRIIIAGTPISIPVLISDFSIEPERAGEPGDIYYSIEFTEWSPIKAEIIEAPKASTASTSGTRPSEPKPQSKTYSVVKGDSLWLIAKKHYGNGAQWRRIYDANKTVIGKNPDLIYPGQKLVIP